MTPFPSGGVAAPGEHPRFLSEADCHDIVDRLARFADGGGFTGATIISSWVGYVRWARNQIVLAGDVSNPQVKVIRSLNGAESAELWINETSDAALVAANRRAERLARLDLERPEASLLTHFVHEPDVPRPPLFDDATYQMDADKRAAAAESLIQSATEAGMLAAGYIEVSAHSQAMLTSWGYTAYCQYTWARYSVTVRDPKSGGSGWAGVDWSAWDRIKGAELSALALEKCLKSRNPVAIEPGRYTTILEPQAVADLVQHFVGNNQFQGGSTALFRAVNEFAKDAPFHKRGTPSDPYYDRETKLGERIMDERITISADPMDPDLGFPPESPKNWYVDMDRFDIGTDVSHPVTWIDRGVLTNLGYNREYAAEWLGRKTGQPNEGAFRMRVEGATTSMPEMIATTKRGLLITRFSGIRNPLMDGSALCRGYTRDGVWLIENGAISQASRNLLFFEDALGVLNRVEQLGVPQRVFNPLPAFGDPRLTPQPIVVPALKIRDFNFIALSNAV